ncbi:MAG: DUF4287 domain-containing protein [Caulobacteraceae bacterium]|nr:DUF4287 domain-containing protein [Caulobacteraceae bacterium]
MAARDQLTERQERWFASVRAGLERETGRSLAEWVAIARTCPESGHRARLKWFKTAHGLLQNRASYVLSEAFPPAMGWSEPDALREALWTDPASRAVYEAVRAAAEALPEVVAGQRKAYSAWSRKVQFAAVRPVRGGGAMLGLALAPDADPRLQAPKNESWSERLRSRLALASPGEADASVAALLEAAWAVS